DSQPTGTEQNQCRAPIQAQTVPDTGGLDPAIHLLRQMLYAEEMDPRVKPAGDGLGRCGALSQIDLNML
ncbi:MAG TPA: hypothetical protein VG145_13735, partial [Xanthobacteraceae bacterium]|nr:hypothetical protein [Xanthobacteraceae bacterium]